MCFHSETGRLQVQTHNSSSSSLYTRENMMAGKIFSRRHQNRTSTKINQFFNVLVFLHRVPKVYMFTIKMLHCKSLHKHPIFETKSTPLEIEPCCEDMYLPINSIDQVMLCKLYNVLVLIRFTYKQCSIIWGQMCQKKKAQRGTYNFLHCFFIFLQS